MGPIGPSGGAAVQARLLQVTAVRAEVGYTEVKKTASPLLTTLPVEESDIAVLFKLAMLAMLEPTHVLAYGPVGLEPAADTQGVVVTPLVVYPALASEQTSWNPVGFEQYLPSTSVIIPEAAAGQVQTL